MRKMTGKQLKASEAKRDIGAELLQAALQIRSGKATRLHRIDVPAIVEIRIRAGLSRLRFAAVLGASPATLMRWERGQRKPTGAARSLLKIAKLRPDVFRDIFACQARTCGRTLMATLWQSFGRRSMPKMTEKQLIARDAKRDLAAELLQTVRDMKAGKAARMHRIKVPEIVEA